MHKHGWRQSALTAAALALLGAGPVARANDPFVPGNGIHDGLAGVKAPGGSGLLDVVSDGLQRVSRAMKAEKPTDIDVTKPADPKLDDDYAALQVLVGDVQAEGQPVDEIAQFISKNIMTAEDTLAPDLTVDGVGRSSELYKSIKKQLEASKKSGKVTDAEMGEALANYGLKYRDLQRLRQIAKISHMITMDGDLQKHTSALAVARLVAWYSAHHPDTITVDGKQVKMGDHPSEALMHIASQELDRRPNNGMGIQDVVHGFLDRLYAAAAQGARLEQKIAHQGTPQEFRFEPHKKFTALTDFWSDFDKFYPGQLARAQASIPQSPPPKPWADALARAGERLRQMADNARLAGLERMGARRAAMRSLIIKHGMMDEFKQMPKFLEREESIRKLFPELDEQDAKLKPGSNIRRYMKKYVPDLKRGAELRLIPQGESMRRSSSVIEELKTMKRRYPSPEALDQMRRGIIERSLGEQDGMEMMDQRIRDSLPQ